jgi:hypothetical protein
VCVWGGALRVGRRWLEKGMRWFQLRAPAGRLVPGTGCGVSHRLQCVACCLVAACAGHRFCPALSPGQWALQAAPLP